MLSSSYVRVGLIQFPDTESEIREQRLEACHKGGNSLKTYFGRVCLCEGFLVMLVKAGNRYKRCYRTFRFYFFLQLILKPQKNI